MKVRAGFNKLETPVVDISVQCPKCVRWFKGRSITEYDIYYKRDIMLAVFSCESCGHSFTGCGLGDESEDVQIEEVSSADECYDGCLDAGCDDNCERTVL